MVRDVCRYIEANLEESLTLAALGRPAGLSPHHLQRTFKRILGITPRGRRDPGLPPPPPCRLAIRSGGRFN
jgi:AraC family transcriptional regulator of adaptative response/methylated-DNA-[protein]-cysteine methyltransferase